MRPGDAALRKVFAEPLSLAFRVRHQRQNQRGRKSLPTAPSRGYTLHAPEVECIGKGKAHRPYDLGVKVSVATTLAPSKGGKFIAHLKALPGNPYDGHSLATVVPEIEAQVGANLARIVADRSCRGHNAPPDHKLKVIISGQKRGITDAIKRDLLPPLGRRAVIGHAKAKHRMGRNLQRKATPPTPSSRPLAKTSETAGLAGHPLARLRHGRPCGGERRPCVLHGRLATAAPGFGYSPGETMSEISLSLTPLTCTSSGRSGKTNLTLLRAPSQPIAPENPRGRKNAPPSRTSIQAGAARVIL